MQSTFQSRLIASVPIAFKFKQDNPGGSWLENKRKQNDEAGRGRFGEPLRFGPITGSFSRPVLLPISLLKTLPGLNGEQSRVREDSLSALLRIMKKSNKLPIENGKQYAPFVVVDQEGDAWVNEGNHRIMAAAHLGWKCLPVELKYFTGGEDRRGCLIPPEKVSAFDSHFLREGYLPINEFRGSLPD